ncbi:U4/U6 x U5 tri-snRNP complex subunit Prp1, partial [Spiromyces aspiralis]
MVQVDKDFLGKPAPPNYVAGLGRGATGFTTRTDIGPARDSGLNDKIPASSAAGGEDEGNDRYQDPDNETGLFNTAPYEQDDEEADRIWLTIEERMDSRRRKQREENERRERERLQRENPLLSDQFGDLKRQLGQLSEGEWAAIPEATNLSGKRRKKEPKMERYSAVPDSMLMTDFREIGQARDKMLEMRLDQMKGDSVSGKTTIDPKGYLTSLNSSTVLTAAEIGDVQKARQLLKSVTVTNPKHAPGWIAMARLEEVAQKMGAARTVIAKGCEECPKSEDVWLEAARLNTRENAKVILASAVRELPKSVRIWMTAADLEDDVKKKRRVLRRALEFVPTSVQLWKAAVSLEEPENAKVLLSRAVELVPLSVELWLALAKLEKYEDARRVINQARKAVPTSHEIWFAAAQLEEQQGHEDMVDRIIPRAVLELAKRGTTFKRERWIKEAEIMEESGSLMVCRAIIRATANVDLEENDAGRADIWVSEAEGCQASGHIECARVLFSVALKEYPKDPDLWIGAADLESESGTVETLLELLEKAVENCTEDETLWLMLAKEKWKRAEDVDGARRVLLKALEVNPASEAIWLAAIKIEITEREYERARVLLERTRNSPAGTARIWLKSAVLERNLGNLELAHKLASEGIEKWPDFPKLWMVKAQLEGRDEARATYSLATKKCPNCVTLWCLAAELEPPIKARAILERIRARNPKSDKLWLESIRVEKRAGNEANARTLLSRALKECPKSGILWSEAIMSERPQGRKAKSTDAVKQCGDAHVICT